MILALSITAVAALLLAAAFRAFELVPQFARLVYPPHQRPCAGGWAEALTRGCDHAGPYPLQPKNAWSNLAYVLAGWWTGDPWFALAMTALGLSSALYHGLTTVWAGRLDVQSIYLVLGYLILDGVLPGWGALPVAAVTAYGLGNAFYRNMDRSVGILLSGALLVRFFQGLDVRPLVVSGALLGSAYAIWHVDKKRLVPGDWGHAIWHVLTAAAFAVLA